MTQSRSLLQKLVLSVPATAAYCVLARTLKQGGPFVGERPSVTLIEVPYERWLETFEQAAEFYIRAARKRTQPSEDGYEGDAKVVVREKGHPDRLGKELIAVASSYRRVLVLVAKGDEIQRDVRISANAAVTLPLPTWSDLAVACRIGRQARISRADAEFLATCPPDDIRLALRPGRDVADGIASLRTHAAVSAAPRRDAVTEAPTLLELSGYGEAKDWGLDLARDLSDWKEGNIPWADVDRGVLLSGPPGCGKTVFASALGRTCDVPVVLGSLAKWQAKGHMGDLLKAMRRAFDDARSKTPSILFFDEFDSIGDREKFTGDNAQYCTEVVNGLLECMDGAEGREGVVIVGACNHPDRLDAAFIRPGRLERHIRIPLPDAASRLAILRHHLGGETEDQPHGEFIRHSEGWTGADIDALVRRARRIARKERKPPAATHLLEAMPARQAFPDAMKRRMAVHEAVHAVVALAVGLKAREVRIVDGIPKEAVGFLNGGATVTYSDEILGMRETHLARIAATFGGMAAERIVIGNHSDGAGGSEDSNLRTATELASLVEGAYAMGEHLVSWASENPGDMTIAWLRSRTMERRVEALLQEQMRRADDAVRANRHAVDLLTARLVAGLRVDGAEVLQIFNGPPHAASAAPRDRERPSVSEAGKQAGRQQ